MVNVATRFAEEVQMLDLGNGIRGAIAIHSTILGPAAGGCRLWQYSSDAEATADALRLSEGMTRKNAIAELPLGGGKAVIRVPDGSIDREQLFLRFGEAINQLNGRYITAEDVGTTVADMRTVARATSFVAGLPASWRRPGGDPSPWTARGVFVAMAMVAQDRLSRPLKDCTVAIQGVGNVGASLATLLHQSGARLIIADVDRKRVEAVSRRTGARIVPVESIVSEEADVFAPCALGGSISDTSVRVLKAKVICGAANNQLATAEDGERLANSGVLYAPDYVVNAGGIINVAAEYLGWSSSDVRQRVERTGERLAHVLGYAEECAISPSRAADELADKKVTDAGSRTPHAA